MPRITMAVRAGKPATLSLSLGLALCMGVCISVAALATPGSGVVSNVVSRATAASAFNIKFKSADFEVEMKTDVLYITPVGAVQRVDQPAPGNCPF